MPDLGSRSRELKINDLTLRGLLLTMCPDFFQVFLYTREHFLKKEFLVIGAQRYRCSALGSGGATGFQDTNSGYIYFKLYERITKIPKKNHYRFLVGIQKPKICTEQKKLKILARALFWNNCFRKKRPC